MKAGYLTWFSGKSWKDCFIFKKNLKNKFNMIFEKEEVSLNRTEIEDIFERYSKNKVTIKAQNEYNNFKDYFKNKEIKFKSKTFILKKWRQWCERIHPISIDIQQIDYSIDFKKFGTKKVFELWKNHNISKDFKFSEMKNAILNFENYAKINKKMIIKNYNNNNSNQSEKQKEKADYRWDFRKAKDTSDRIKEWLEFEKGIKWLEDFYLKDIPIPGIGWKDVMHPDFNREEILLFKIDSQNGQYMLKNTSDDIIEAEVQEYE